MQNRPYFFTSLNRIKRLAACVFTSAFLVLVNTANAEQPLSQIDISNEGKAQQLSLRQYQLHLPFFDKELTPRSTNSRAPRYREWLRQDLTLQHGQLESDLGGGISRQLNHASLKLQYQQQRRGGYQLLLAATPTWAVTETSTDSDAFFADGYIGLRRQWLNRSGERRIQLGVFSDQRFGDSQLRPAFLYAKTQALRSGQQHWQIGFPHSFWRYQSKQHWGVSAHLRPQGGRWLDEKANAADPSQLRYSGWQLAVGGEFLWRKNLWLKAELGQSRNRRLQFSDATGAKQVLHPGNQLFSTIGLAVYY